MLGMTTPSFQDLILRLHNFGARQGCVILQSYDVEMGAGVSVSMTRRLVRLRRNLEGECQYGCSSRSRNGAPVNGFPRGSAKTRLVRDKHAGQ